MAMDFNVLLVTLLLLFLVTMMMLFVVMRPSMVDEPKMLSICVLMHVSYLSFYLNLLKSFLFFYCNSMKLIFCITFTIFYLLGRSLIIFVRLFITNSGRKRQFLSINGLKPVSDYAQLNWDWYHHELQQISQLYITLSHHF